MKSLHKISRRTKRHKFKMHINRVNNIKKYANFSYYENIDGLIKLHILSKSKSYWQLMCSLGNNTVQSTSIPSLFIPQNGKLVFNNTEKANILNNDFCSIANYEINNSKCPYFPSRYNNMFKKNIYY